ncbi:MAG TPA: RecX family transcriptional regulator, partial [Myxococcaceae bacterium]|nr:RecX family transcriptional regulator [Myxococcaceae bacterium]
LLRRGRSVRQIQMRLRARGVSAEEVAAGIAEVTEASAGSPDAAAALAFARRKRLGPFRRAPADEQRRAKELASLARAGFSYGLAKRVVNADSVEQLEADMLHSRFSVEPDPETP